MTRSNKNLIIVLCCLGITIWLAGCSRPVKEDAAAAQTPNQDSSEPAGQEAVPAVNVNFDITQYEGIPTGFTPEGYPYRGSPDAPVTIVEYSDYLCPFCKRHFDETVPGLMEAYVRSGKVQYVFRDFPIASLHPTAPQGHTAAWCVGEKDAALYWQMHDLLFATRDQWNSFPDPSGFLASLAETLGMDSVAYESCMDSKRTQTIVDQGVAAAGEKGFNGTPSFEFVANGPQKTYTLIGAQSPGMFKDWLDSMVAGNEPPQAEQAEGDENKLPFWARSDGLRPNPLRPGTTMAGDPYRGNPDAKVVVVEYTDFQCPACAEFAIQTQPAVQQKYVDSGQIMWVFKNLPLSSHRQAPAAAAAGECAAEQGKFWEMHDQLFATVTRWAVEDPDPPLRALAQDLGLNQAEFDACLSGRQAMERVLEDVYDSMAVTSSAPTFVFLHDGVGEVTRGALSVERFNTVMGTVTKNANSDDLAQ